MNWLLFTLLSVLFVSIAGILQKALMKDDKSNPYAYAVVFQFLVAILNLPIAIVHGFHPPILSDNLAFFIIAAALWGGGSVFFFKALKLIEASEVTIMSSLRVVITIAASLIFLQEAFNSLKVLGAVAILVSIFLVSNLKKGIRFNKGVTYSVILAVFSGFAIVADGFNVKNYDVISYSAIVNFLIFFILLLCNPKVLKQWRDFVQPNFLKKMLPIGVFATVQGVAFLFALASGGNVSQVGTIRQASVILTVVLAAIFLNEKDNLIRKIIAAILVTFGVILLS